MAKLEFAQVLLQSKKILKEYDLCDYCLGRLYTKKLGLTSNKHLGQKIRKKVRKRNTRCYICKNIFEDLTQYLAKMLEASDGYEFRTFLVGAILRPSVLDRDDQIRSQFKLKGIDSIKTNITRELAKRFAKKRHKKYDSVEPDLTFTVDFKTESCSVQSKPLYVFGRYSKQTRGIPQKQKPCENCAGKGCLSCNRHGISDFDSVEGMICKYLFERFGAQQAKLTWIGGEDSSSLVLGHGRPFFAKIINPKKRSPSIPKKIKSDKIIIKSLKTISKIPTSPVQFVSSVKILVSTENPVSSSDLLRLDQLKKTTLAIYENSGKRAEKLIYNVSFKKESDNSFHLYLRVDGGVPLKRLVSGENVFPNISDILSNRCKCEIFDFEDIKLTN
ncbi:MAG TPA: tRNA pseudouridine(54/55) synthase Pus10 [Candidatus Nitrosotenuis sp.]|nr:tRNA pseudouridine(54/55) synthase Pus10 [Candidatus Nitrosotenuis sp.]